MGGGSSTSRLRSEADRLRRRINELVNARPYAERWWPAEPPPAPPRTSASQALRSEIAWLRRSVVELQRRGTGAGGGARAYAAPVPPVPPPPRPPPPQRPPHRPARRRASDQLQTFRLWRRMPDVPSSRR
jgi:hypothetical protein